MTKKIKKKTNSKKPVNKKSKQNHDDNFESLGISILGDIGIIVLIYFGLKTEIEGNNNIDAKKEKTEKNAKKQEDKIIMIDGLIYPSKEYALKMLKDVPQTQLTEEQRAFVINPDGFKN